MRGKGLKGRRNVELTDLTPSPRPPQLTGKLEDLPTLRRRLDVHHQEPYHENRDDQCWKRVSFPLPSLQGREWVGGGEVEERSDASRRGARVLEVSARSRDVPR